MSYQVGNPASRQASIARRTAKVAGKRQIITASAQSNCSLQSQCSNCSLEHDPHLCPAARAADASVQPGTGNIAAGRCWPAATSAAPNAAAWRGMGWLAGQLVQAVALQRLNVLPIRQPAPARALSRARLKSEADVPVSSCAGSICDSIASQLNCSQSWLWRCRANASSGPTGSAGLAQQLHRNRP